MITRITGTLVSVSPDACGIAAGPFEYEVYVPAFVFRNLQGMVGKEVTLKTIDYLEGTPGKGNLTPRLIGFLSDAERDFFDAICSVDGVGVKKALRAMVRPVRDVAIAIEEQDVKQLTTLPGIGPSLAERIVAKLRRKMAKFALMTDMGSKPFSPVPQDDPIVSTAFEALVSVGHPAPEARQMIERLLAAKKKFDSVEEMLHAIYQMRSAK